MLFRRTALFFPAVTFGGKWPETLIELNFTTYPAFHWLGSNQGLQKSPTCNCDTGGVKKRPAPFEREMS